MGRHKNKLKDRVGCCFFCGRELTNHTEKIIHRLNTKKGPKAYNIIIVCEFCKQRLLLHDITDIDIKTEVLHQYFKKFNRNCRHLVMYKVFRYIIYNNKLLKKSVQHKT